MANEAKPGASSGAGTPIEMARVTVAAPERPIMDLAGWKSISAHIGMSARFAYDAAHRHEDPLPVQKLGRTVMASSAALNEWLRRQLRPVGQGASLRLVAANG